MNNEDVKIGMKVVPHAKSGCGGFGTNLAYSVVWAKAQSIQQPYLFVTGRSGCWLLNETYREGMIMDGDFFQASDFKPYEEIRAS